MAPTAVAALTLSMLLVGCARVPAPLPPVAAPAPPAAIDVMPEGPSVSARLEEIQRRIQQALEYPALARVQGLEGDALVGFEVGHDGAPTGIALVRSSGSALLDRAARRAVEDAAPLPWTYGRLEVPVRFSLRDASR